MSPDEARKAEARAARAARMATAMLTHTATPPDPDELADTMRDAGDKGWAIWAAAADVNPRLYSVSRARNRTPAKVAERRAAALDAYRAAHGMRAPDPLDGIAPADGSWDDIAPRPDERTGGRPLLRVIRGGVDVTDPLPDDR